MIKILLRTFSFIFLLLALLFFTLYLIWGNDLPQWQSLYKNSFEEMPYIAWIGIAVVSFSIMTALWASSLTRQKERQLYKALDTMHHGELETAKLRPLSKKNRLAIQNLDELIQNQKKSLQRMTNDTANTQEKAVQERLVAERQRLARELHDSVSQQLFAASMLLSATNETVQDQLPEATIKQLQQTEKIVQQAQLEMRALLLHLRPIALKNKSLTQGLQDLLNELRQKVLFNIQDQLEEVDLPKGAEDHIFRIAQETLSNTLRHAKATEVHLLLVQRDAIVIFRIQDNGIGFSMQEEQHAGSYGLRNVEERAIEIGGTCKIIAIPNEGTIIEVQVPIEQEESSL